MLNNYQTPKMNFGGIPAELFEPYTARETVSKKDAIKIKNQLHEIEAFALRPGLEITTCKDEDSSSEVVKFSDGQQNSLTCNLDDNTITYEKNGNAQIFTSENVGNDNFYRFADTIDTIREKSEY